MLAAAGGPDSGSRRATPTRARDRPGSASKSNIIAIDESGASMGASLVDFDLSESKFTMGGFLDRTPNLDSQADKTLAFSRQGTETEMPSAIKKSEEPLHRT